MSLRLYPQGTTCITKMATQVVSRSLSSIFDDSISEGVFLESWKYSMVAPIFKSGSKSEMRNHTQISVLSTLARIFERLIYDQLSKYLEQNNYLTKYQSGIRKFHSAITSLLKSNNN